MEAEGTACAKAQSGRTCTHPQRALGQWMAVSEAGGGNLPSGEPTVMSVLSVLSGPAFTPRATWSLLGVCSQGPHLQSRQTLLCGKLEIQE